MNRHYYGLILAGGRGTRFWPRSRKRSAKQVLNVVGERTLIQATVDRLTPVIAPERIWVLTNDHLRATIIKQLPDVPTRPPGLGRGQSHPPLRFQPFEGHVGGTGARCSSPIDPSGEPAKLFHQLAPAGRIVLLRSRSQPI